MTLLQERSRLVNRIHKVLEDANLKLASVVTAIMGMTGHAILTALVAGETDPERLVHLARGNLVKKQEQLKAALAGKLTPHHRVLLEELLHLIATVDRSIARLDREIAERLRSHDALIERVDAVTGLSRRSIEVLLGELGWDMSHFPDAAHAASWVGICPGNHETGGKRLSGRIRQGNRWAKTVLVQAAHAAGHTQSYLGEQYRRGSRATRDQESGGGGRSQYSGDFRVPWSRPESPTTRKELTTFSQQINTRSSSVSFDNWNVWAIPSYYSPKGRRLLNLNS
jgi:transposase